MLRRAFDKLADDSPAGLNVELGFYLFAHGPVEERKTALSRLKQLLTQRRARSPGWDLSWNNKRATADGHPDAAWLPKLAAVISDEAEPSVLDGWQAWRDA